MDTETKKLYDLAISNLVNSYSPYSNFPVSAVLKTKNGLVFSGVNIENASYGLSICAERVCLFNYRNANLQDDYIDTLVVTGETEGPISPCGACRQVMAEFMEPKTRVVLTNKNGQSKETTVGELLPYNFTQEDLNNG